MSILSPQLVAMSKGGIKDVVFLRVKLRGRSIRFSWTRSIRFSGTAEVWSLMNLHLKLAGDGKKCCGSGLRPIVKILFRQNKEACGSLDQIRRKVCQLPKKIGNVEQLCDGLT